LRSLRSLSCRYSPYGDRQGRGAIGMLVELREGTRAWCICTHLQHDPTGLEQELQVEELLDWIEKLERDSGVGNVVVGGDMNSPPFFRGIRTLMKELGEDGRPGAITFPYVGKSIGTVLDYLFVRGEEIERGASRVRVLDSDTASDHYPIMRTLA
jgi:endonuclease/exonuclease/phosphatase (EEP) superfamily protein YafD